MRSRRAFGKPVSWRLSRPGMTAQEFTRESAPLQPEVPSSTPAPLDMPGLELMLLDALADDSETLYTMRNCGDMQPNGLALVGKAALLDAVRELLEAMLIEVESEYVVSDGLLVERALVSRPGTSDHDLCRYWFVMTSAGQARLGAAAPELDDYWDQHPLKAR